MASLQRKFQDLIYLVSGRQKRGRGRPAASGNGLAGSRDPIYPGGRIQRRNNHLLEVPELILRPTMMDLGISHEIEELIRWSPEMSTCLTILSQNVFQDETGAIGSWKIRTKDKNGIPLERQPHPNVIAIADNLSRRKDGAEYVLGAQRLEEQVYCVARGSEFLELAITKEGIGRNDYGISKTLTLPRWSCFVQASEQGEVETYRQQARFDISDQDRVWSGVDLAKIIHFKYKPQGRYGFPGVFAQVEPWRKLKQLSQDIEAGSASALAPWILEMPSDRDEAYRQSFRSELEAQMEQGMITHLYLPNGADMRKAASATPTMKPLLDVMTQLRYQTILPSFPCFLVAGLALEAGVGKELSGQNAMAYGRLIAHMRSILGEGIHRALAIEIVMNYGYEWYLEHSDYELEWPEWKNQDYIPGVNPMDPKKVEEKEAEAKEKLIRLNGDKVKELLG
jgi:hypothetical protein